MSVISITVDEQNLHITDSPKIAAQGVNENYVKFSFSADWDGFAKVALFYNEEDPETVYQSLVDTSGSALIPWEVTNDERRICLGVSGVKDDVVKTSEILKYKIVKGLYVVETAPPTPGIYEQILTAVGEIQDTVEDIQETVEGIVTPTASVTETETGARITITDKNGTTTVDVKNGTATDAQVETYVEEWLEDHPEATTTVQDGSISMDKLAADVLAAINRGGGLTEDIKVALLTCFENVAWIGDDGQDYYDALEEALYPPAGLVSISAVFSPGAATIYNTDSLDDLKQYLTVTALYDDLTTEEVSNYVLSGSMAAGTQTITVTYAGKTTTFTVTVAEWVTAIAAVYTPSGTVYDTASLNDLKANLVVTATYADSTTGTIPSADYTLSGTLAEGTSTITVTYAGKSDTFTVTVVHKEWEDGVPYNFEWVENKYISNTTGGETNYNGWNASPFLNCDGAGHLVIHNGFAASTGYNGWYDENQTWIDKFSVPVTTGSDTTSIEVPANAVYFRVSYNASGTGGDGTYTITPTIA